MAYMAKHRYARISPRKVRLVLDLIRGRSANESMDILQGVTRRASVMVTKVLKSAVANAVDLDDPDVDKLKISKATADEGPVLKRFRHRARGRGAPIHKPTSHITIELELAGE